MKKQGVTGADLFRAFFYAGRRLHEKHFGIKSTEKLSGAPQNERAFLEETLTEVWRKYGGRLPAPRKRSRG